MKETEIDFTDKLLLLERKLNEAKVALTMEIITQAQYDEALHEFHEEYEKVRHLQRGD